MNILILLMLFVVLDFTEQQRLMVNVAPMSKMLWTNLDQRLENLLKKQDSLRRQILAFRRILQDEGLNVSRLLEQNNDDDYIDPFGYSMLNGARDDVTLLKLLYNQGNTSNTSDQSNTNIKSDEVCTPYTGGYTFFRINGNEFKFKVRTDKDAYIGISRAADNSPPFYRIVLGGWGNTQSVIQLSDSNTNAVAKTQGIVNDCQYRGFWIRWDNETITVGYEENQAPFLSHNHGGQLYQVKYVGLTTGQGATGNWLFNRETL